MDLIKKMMDEKVIILTEERARDLYSLIADAYPEDLRYSPRDFINETNGKASAYYYLLESIAALHREEKKPK